MDKFSPIAERLFEFRHDRDEQYAQQRAVPGVLSRSAGGNLEV